MLQIARTRALPCARFLLHVRYMFFIVFLCVALYVSCAVHSNIVWRLLWLMRRSLLRVL